MESPDEKLAAEASRAALCLIIMKDMPVTGYAPGYGPGYGDSYKTIGINYSLEACEIAARVIGIDPFYARMLNHKFRTDAAELMLERALHDVKPLATQ